MRKTDLVKQVCARCQLSIYQADDVVAAVLEQITNALARGDRVQLPRLGTFTVRQRQARAGKNPQTGEHLHIAAKNQVAFKAAKQLRDQLSTKE